jgi:predicted ATP-grasp superfamily ATP-dependent carboligase
MSSAMAAGLEAPRDRVPVIVLCNTVTGIATVRALAESGVEVHAFVFHPDDPLHDSRYATKVSCDHLLKDDAGLIRFVIHYARKLGNRPVVLPTGDAHALLLAKHFAELDPYCRVWQLPHDDLRRMVNKTMLYQAAQAAGVPVIPSLSTPTLAEVGEWSRHNQGPYILKPGYEGLGSCKLNGKNLVLEGREQLLAYVRSQGADSLVIQQMIRGGDGNIFDCYGLCDRNGRVVCLTSHHRIRQYPPDFGATSIGEIPAPLPTQQEEFLFAATERLFNRVRFHGIFGIEWLRDEKTGAFYLIDFNARPFLTIGHLRDCGVNLPLLAYRDLIGESLEDIEPRPVVKRKRWVYITKDLDTFRMLRASRRMSVVPWLMSVASCRSFAYASFRDPMPGLRSLLQIAERVVRYIFRAGKSRELPSSTTPDTTAAPRTLPR